MANRTPPLTLPPGFTLQLSNGYGRFVKARPWEKISFSTYLRQLLWLGLQQMEAELDAADAALSQSTAKSAEPGAAANSTGSPADIQPGASPALGRPRKKKEIEDKISVDARFDAMLELIRAGSAENQRVQLVRAHNAKKEAARKERAKARAKNKQPPTK